MLLLIKYEAMVPRRFLPPPASTAAADSATGDDVDGLPTLFPAIILWCSTNFPNCINDDGNEMKLEVDHDGNEMKELDDDGQQMKELKDDGHELKELNDDGHEQKLEIGDEGHELVMAMTTDTS